MPESLEDTGISLALIEQLILKFLYFRGEVMGRDLASLLGLQYSLIDELLETLKRQHHVGVKKSLGMGNSSGVFALTESGRNLTREYLENNQYAGTGSGASPPVRGGGAAAAAGGELADAGFAPARLQTSGGGAGYPGAHRTGGELQQVVPDLRPARQRQDRAGRSAVPRGDGARFTCPTRSSARATSCSSTTRFITRRSTMRNSDSVTLDRDHGFDRRWFKCRRPFIITGGELGLDMLDLSFNKVSKVYDAPFQLKANNGIYLIDDFGRQKASPAEILNRWIVPMERHVDYLSFQAGGKMTVPFEAFLIFSTNLRPDQLGDEAFLRRIQYKMFLRSPGKDEFVEIFERFAESRLLDHAPGVIEGFVDKHYVKGRQTLPPLPPPRRHQPCHRPHQLRVAAQGADRGRAGPRVRQLLHR